jgi:hypothetical protein
MDTEVLTPEETADYLERRYKLKRGKRRLQEMRASGEGPSYFRASGNSVLYRRDLVDAWAIELLGEPLRSTAEEQVRHRLAEAEKGRLPATPSDLKQKAPARE